MKCVICKQGQTYQGITSIALFRGEKTIIIKNVPAQICENCGEYYLSEPITDSVLNLASQTISNNNEVDILKFAA